MANKKCKKCGNDSLYDGEYCICCVYHLTNPEKKPSCNVEGCNNCKNKKEKEAILEEIKADLTVYRNQNGKLALMLETSSGHRFYFESETKWDMILSDYDDYLTNGVTVLKRKRSKN